jgi:glycosyltransferase involved in cell wall biosynthesis
MLWRGPRLAIHAALAVYIGLLRLGKRVGPRPRQIPPGGADVLLTGTFHSDNWIRSHVLPIAMSSSCARVRLVATNPVPDLPKVEAVYPPNWLLTSVGTVPARLLVFTWLTFKDRPHVIGAFHLLINGLVASLLARWAGARALYFCVGGPVEVFEGGLHGENKYFTKLRVADPLVERWLLEAVDACHLIVTMGTRAVTFFRERGVGSTMRVISGGIDADRFAPPSADEKVYDVALVGRLVPIKRIDIFVRAIAVLVRTRPSAQAVIVGDGPLRADLERLVKELGIESHVTFAGQQTDVQAWLRRTRIFSLTSESEGLALSLMEAMTCGLPGVVPAVGDLGDLVTDDLNGYLVAERAPEAYAARYAELLGDPRRYAAFAAAARSAARKFETAEAVRLWDHALKFPETRAETVAVR